MRHGRLHWYTPNELTRQQHAIYAGVRSKYGPNPPFVLTDQDGRLHGPFNAMLAAPGVGAALQHLSMAVGAETSLSQRLRELVILTVAVHRDSRFEWFAHHHLAGHVGVSPSELATVAAGELPTTLDRTEHAVLTMTRELLTQHDVTTETSTTVQELYGEAVLVELTTLVGYYELLATLLRVVDVPLPPE